MYKDLGMYVCMYECIDWNNDKKRGNIMIEVMHAMCVCVCVCMCVLLLLEYCD